MIKQKPLLAVKRTVTGLGLFAQETIRPEKRIVEYAGTLLTNEEADKKGGKYLMNLDNKYTIDGSAFDNIARYINHSCRPNAEALIYGKRVWIYSKKTIKAGEEITINYGKEYFDQIIKGKGCKCKKCKN